MNVLRHDYCSVQNELVVVPLEAAPQDGIAGCGWERIMAGASKCHKQCPVGFLIMRKLPPVVVHATERNPFRREMVDFHTCQSVGRTFLSGRVLIFALP